MILFVVGYEIYCEFVQKTKHFISRETASYKFIFEENETKPSYHRVSKQININQKNRTRKSNYTYVNEKENNADDK